MNNRKGFSYLELMIYISIASVVLLAMLRFSLYVVQQQVKDEVLATVAAQHSSAVYEIRRQIHNAVSISPVTLYDDTQGVLVLTHEDAETTLITTVQRSVQVGQQQVQIRSLQLTHGSDDPIYLTGERVDVSIFGVDSHTYHHNDEVVELELTVSHVNPSGDKRFDASMHWKSSYGIRVR